MSFAFCSINIYIFPYNFTNIFTNKFNILPKYQKYKKYKNNDNVNDNDIYNTTSEDKSSTVDTAKANNKHKYGTYKHVLLKDEELQTLKKDYSNWNELIEYLDEYIEMKGYKAKSHYLAIKKWVVDAIKEKKNRKVININNHTGRTYNDLNKFYDNLGEQNVKSL